MDQSEAMEPNNSIQNKIDLSKAEESIDLNNEIAETPTNITDNETGNSITVMHNFVCMM